MIPWVIRKRETLEEVERGKSPNARTVVPEAANHEAVAASSNNPTSSSSKKIKLVPLTTLSATNDSLGNGIVNMDLLMQLLRKFPCLVCKANNVFVKLDNLGGLAQRFVLECESCGLATVQDFRKQLEG